ncbi:putative thioredoxin reductase [Alkalihalophilus pseudofirmus OF4]|uniref:Thioredoxin reductase n=1 Tax=Alkalihalophilus pseudofirmus (strain ATCC BAA-2126 / JCM 17055 / OF4) TaxID=398511 RepID=D3FQA4_ALKPO|nr:NAD(P)/FAD-dependent oxidoreductase [Alkalihalophilus pseudofirmus]ADC49576.1 putative thioredoxin reductase [Alkalihalophilus pseudofirmus OF4]
MYDCVIVGGGIAGLQAAIQLGRYEHRVLVIDSDGGRSLLCKSYHNILGYPYGVSGDYLRSIGKEHAVRLGVQFLQGKVETINKHKTYFTLQTDHREDILGKRVLLATGIMDRFPKLEGLLPCLGKSVYVCPDCDGYEIKDMKTVIIGSGDVGANMALTLLYWSKNLLYINHEKKTVSKDLLKQLKEKGVEYIQEEVSALTEEDGLLLDVRLKNGNVIKVNKGFIAFGGNEVRSDLAQQLGAERLSNKHIVVDPRSKMTSVEHVWAAGDVAAHSEQVTIAMGEGSQAAIWIHKSLC